MHLKQFVLSLPLFSGLLFAGNTFGINANSNDAELVASLNFDTYASYDSGTSYSIDLSSLSSDSENLFTAAFIGEGQTQGTQGIKAGFGLKAAVAKNFGALPLMGRVIYPLPLNTQFPPTDFTASFSYAPSVLTFDDGEKYTEFRMEVASEVIQNIHMYVGYRTINVDYKATNNNFNSSFYAGLKLSF